jgi:hypothetical protein
MKNWKDVLVELGFYDLPEFKDVLQDSDLVEDEIPTEIDENKYSDDSKLFIFKEYFKFYFKIFISWFVNLSGRYLLMFVRKMKIFYNNYRFIPDFMMKFISYGGSILGLHVFRQYFESVANRPGFVSWTVDVVRSIIYGSAMGLYLMVSTVSKTVYDTDRLTQNVANARWTTRITAYTSSDLVRSYIISIMYGVCVTLFTSLFVFVGIDYIYRAYMLSPLPPIEGIPYTEKYCNPLVWRDCISKNIYPGMGFPYVGDELSKCLDLCSDDSVRGVWKLRDK